jgi:hypothetical protein
MCTLAKIFGLGILSLTVVCDAAPSETAAAPQFTLPPPKYTVRLEKSLMVRMHDGVRLSTDVYLPEGAGDKLPVILIRTPYNKNTFRHEDSSGSVSVKSSPAHFFATQGYAVVVQDVRGKFESTTATTPRNGLQPNRGLTVKSVGMAAHTWERCNTNRR